jgi:hypothetical protein
LPFAPGIPLDGFNFLNLHVCTMLFYFLNFILVFLQIQTEQRIEPAYHALQAVAWVLIISAFSIFSLFAYLLIKAIIKKRNKRFTVENLNLEKKVFH